MSLEEPKEVQTLAILSGKGGSGKTVIALSMAQVLAEANVKVLLVDCDIATHGSTYFIEPEFEQTSLTILSLSDLLAGEYDSAAKPLVSRSGFAFLPSSLDPSETPQMIQVEEKLENAWPQLAESFEAVLFDCQAGYSDVAQWVANKAARKLVVLEPDAVSSAALRVLSIQLGRALKPSDTWQVFNKLTEEERPIYEKVSGVTLFSNLPPLPFDWQVRAAFATREIPGVLRGDSAFGLAVLRLMHTLFPAFSYMLDQLEKRTVGDWYDEIQRHLKELEEQRDKIKYRSGEYRRKLQLFRNATLSTLGVMAGLSVAYLGYKNLLIYPAVTFPLAGSLIGLASATWIVSAMLESRMGRRMETAQIDVDSIQQDADRFRTLINTDPRLREHIRRQMI